MSTLTTVEKMHLEKFLQMGGGYVLDFIDRTFAEFFLGYDVDINEPTYQIYGTSKARRMRAFWNTQSDTLVARVLEGMFEIKKARAELDDREFDTDLYQKCRKIVSRLQGKPIAEAKSDDEFLSTQFAEPDLNALSLDSSLVPILQSRLIEANLALDSGAHLAVIFLCGSILEGLLLGTASNNVEEFNRAKSSPKGPDKKVKILYDWSLSELINVATETGFLKPDVKEFSHGVRGFRNYIHPYQQMTTRFAPDQHTARICMQVLKAAIASLSGKRD